MSSCEHPPLDGHPNRLADELQQAVDLQLQVRSMELVNGEMPVFVGLDDPGIFVHELVRAANAKRGFAIQRRAVRRGEGTSRDGDGSRVRSGEVAIPKPGDARVAHREMRTQSTGSNRRDYFVEVWCARADISSMPEHRLTGKIQRSNPF
jgi:hypothetical protein